MALTRWMGMIALVAMVGSGVVACGDDTDEAGALSGAPCGNATCADNQYCCFPECGLCVEQGVACPQRGCN